MTQLATELTMNEIHSVSARRQKNWRGRRDPFVTQACTERLNELWERFRVERAQHLYGDRATIAARARVERELERLMSDEG